MKRLTLLRHAKSDAGLPDQQDWDRPLNRRGEMDAPEMARRFKHRKLKPDLILASPAVRALATASIFARVLGVTGPHLRLDERLYLAEPKLLLKVVRELGGTAGHLMVVGHNPGISEFADKLCADRRLDSMPTCALFTVEFDIRAWSDLEYGSGVNADFDYPKNPST